MQGYIHQLESFGCADGPGSRFIIFFSGCPLRCKYCHNRDTWNTQSNNLYSVQDILSKVLKYKKSTHYLFLGTQKNFHFQKKYSSLQKQYFI